LRDIAGGLNTKPYAANNIAENETPNCSDVVFDRGSIVKRKGFERVVNTATLDPGLQFNGNHGHVRVPVHSDFNYGTKWEIVIKARADEVPIISGRRTLFCHGYAGGNTTTCLRAIWIYTVQSSSTTYNLRVTVRDSAGNNQTVSHASNLALDTNYAFHCRRTDTSGTDKIEIDIWNLDTDAAVGSQASASASSANGQYNASALPINIGGAPVLDTTITPGTNIGEDTTGGIYYANYGSDDKGTVQEIWSGTIGEIQVWKNQATRRAASASDNQRVDTGDSDVTAGGRLLAYWMMNEGTGDTISCNTNYSINEATSKDGVVLGYGPTFVTGLVGDAKNPHALYFDGLDQMLHVTDRAYAIEQRTCGGGTIFTNTNTFTRLISSYMLNNNPGGVESPAGTPHTNPWTFGFTFQFHKNSDEYNTNRKQCLCSIWVKMTDMEGAPGPYSYDVPYMVVYLGTDEKLNVDIMTDIDTSPAPAAQYTFNYTTLTSDSALTKDTTYRFDLMKYNDFQNYQMYVDGNAQTAGYYEYAPGGTPTTCNPDWSLFDGTTEALDMYFGMNSDDLLEWTGAGTNYRDISAMPSNCTIDEVTFYAGEDSSGNPVGCRSATVAVGGTAVPATDNPPVENLVNKYKDKEISKSEIRDRVGLWLYYPFDEDWTDYTFHAPGAMWVLDNSRFRYTPGVLLPASLPPKWGKGVIQKVSVDSNYGSNSLVHNPVAAIEGLTNYITDAGSQSLMFVQSSTLWDYTSGNSYTEDGNGFRTGNKTSVTQGKDYIYMVHGPTRPKRWDGTTLELMGIPRPTGPIRCGYVAGSIRETDDGAGNPGEAGVARNKYYTYRYTFYNQDKNLESDPSPESAAFFTNPTHLGLATDTVELLVAVPRYNDSQVTHVRVYRSEPLSQDTGDISENCSKTGSVFYLVAEFPIGREIPQQGSTGAPTADTWWDGLPESGLGVAMPSRKGPPPDDPRFITYWRERTWCARTPDFPSRLWFSEAGEPESYDELSFLDFDDGDGQPITALVPLFNSLMVFKQNSIYTVTEDAGVSAQFIAFPFSKYKVHTNIGCSSHFACQKLDENAVIFLSQKGIYLSDGQQIKYLSEKVENIFRDEISVYKKRNQYIVALSTDGVDNNIALVYDYVLNNWTRFNMDARMLVQTEDSVGVERIFVGGTKHRGYLSRWDSTNTDGAEFVRPASPVEPDSLTGTPSASGSSTTLINTGANWASVTGDGLRGMPLFLTNAAVTTTKHTIVATGTTLTFFPPASATVDTTWTYVIAGIDAIWRSKEFDFGSFWEGKAIQDIEVYQAIQSTTAPATISVALAVDRGSFVTNTNTVDISSGASLPELVPFKGISWVSGGGTSRGKLLQLRLKNSNPNQPFVLHHLLIRLEPEDARR